MNVAELFEEPSHLRGGRAVDDLIRLPEGPLAGEHAHDRAAMALTDKKARRHERGDRLAIDLIVERDEAIESDDRTTLVFEDESAGRVVTAMGILIPPPAHALLPDVSLIISRTRQGELAVAHEGGEELGDGTIGPGIPDYGDDAITHKCS
jgi:hypothetical protein